MKITKNIFIVVFTGLAIETSIPILSCETESLEDLEKKCEICEKLKSSKIDHDYLKESPKSTTIDVSHLLKNKTDNEKLLLWISTSKKHFGELKETRHLNFLEAAAPSKTVTVNIIPGDQQDTCFCLQYTRKESDYTLSLESKTDFHFNDSDIISIDEKEVEQLKQETNEKHPVSDGCAYTGKTSGHSNELKIRCVRKDFKKSFEKTVSRYRVHNYPEKDWYDAFLEEKDNLSDQLQKLDANITNLSDCLDLNKVDISKIGIEQLDFKQLKANENTRTFSGLEKIGLKNLDLAKLDLSKIGLEKLNLDHKIITKIISKNIKSGKLI
ncbi:hypothetical protein KAT92_01140 [Candidatus Babeliales bacterium]|nr:hypothetical protein [Candidatus Babeliales bacterium]